jgi:hypothetical protein
MDPSAQATLFLAVVCSVIMGISRRAGNFILRMAALILRLGMSQHSDISSPSSLYTAAQIPDTLEAALHRFNLKGRTTIYAVCPQCHYTYKPTFKPGSVIPIYPSFCTNTPFPNSDSCGAQLLQESRDSDGVFQPIKPFAYHHLSDFVAELLARKETEERLYSSCDSVLSAIAEQPPEYARTFFDGEFVRTFEGPESTPRRRRLFIDRRGEARIFWCLNVDFFNPEGMRVRGATASCGIISMACLNLGEELCFKPEYMYIAGIIPGPREPRLTELNHYLRPLVDDLRSSWSHGVQYSRTALYPNGNVVRDAIAIIASDLPAARKTAQMTSSVSHNFCSCCDCFNLSTVGRTDFHNWRRKDSALLRIYSLVSKYLASSKEQERFAAAMGVRWSELWRLPYWDPPKQLIVDSMHTILEVLVHGHVREILQLTTEATKQKKTTPAFSWSFSLPHDATPSLSLKERKQVIQVHSLLTAALLQTDNHPQPEAVEGLNKRLGQKNIEPLKFVFHDLKLNSPKKKLYKADIVNELVKWVSQLFEPHSDYLRLLLAYETTDRKR